MHKSQKSLSFRNRHNLSATCTYVRLLGPCFKTGQMKSCCHFQLFATCEKARQVQAQGARQHAAYLNNASLILKWVKQHIIAFPQQGTALCFKIPYLRIAYDRQSKRHHKKHHAQIWFHVHGSWPAMCKMWKNCSASLLPSASHSASSITFNLFPKVFFIFPSWYLCTIGLQYV